MTAEIVPQIGITMHRLAARLFPICRSLTGNGVRQTLAILREYLPDLAVHEVPSGTRCFDWTVPDEWNIRDAYLIGPDGRRIVDFAHSNLHVVNYSEPVDRELSLGELQPHLYSLPEIPDAIPYVTSYYRRNWGFCLSHQKRECLSEGTYRAVIDSTLAPGSLTYADLVIPGATDREVLISTYVCHPSMGNNEVSGPVVANFLARWLLSRPHRRFTYRFVFVPETIGSICYISRHLEHLKSHVVAGFNVTCVGDDLAYSFLPSRKGDTWSDRVARHVLRHRAPDYQTYCWLDRGSDERQYCAPGVDLPITSVMRSKYGQYSFYHTSKDDLSFITPSGLEGGYIVLRECLEALELDCRYRCTHFCEPQMGKRGLYTQVDTRSVEESVRTRMDILTYCDGSHSLLDIAEIISKPIAELHNFAVELTEHQLIERL